MTDLSHLLGKKASDVEKPKPFPVGHYLWTVTGFEVVESSKKKTPGIQFDTQMTEPMDDVDEDELAAVKEPTKRKQRLTFWVTEDSLWRLKEFLTTLGVAEEDDERSIEEMIPECQGATFIARIQHETMQDSSDIIAKIDDRSISKPE